MSDLPAPPPGCPEPAVLAAFVEGTLDRQSRRDVEQHVADCPECPGVIAETVRFLKTDGEEAEGESDPPARAHSWRFAVAAAFAMLCVTGLVWQDTWKRDPLRRVKEIAAEAEVRTVEGRLDGFEHVRFSAPRSLRRVVPGLALSAEAERLTGSDAQMLHARGVALLLTGDVRSALPLLEAATRRKPEDAALQSDLAAGYLVAGSGGDRARLRRALAAADVAIALSPSFASAHFNRAVALERLGRREEALAAYGRAARLESSSAWREETVARMSRLRP
jgi:tetratricopeptide (TPR) repeat protein